MKNKAAVFFFSLFFYYFASAQSREDISLHLSVTPTTLMSPGQSGVMTFEITNHSHKEIAYSVGGDRQTLQADGKLGYGQLEFDENFFSGNCLLGSLSVEPPPKPTPLWWIEVRHLKAEKLETCKIKFTIPETFDADFIALSANIDSGFIDDINTSNNTDTVRINIKPEIKPVPSSSLIGLLALILLIGLITTRYLKNTD